MIDDVGPSVCRLLKIDEELFLLTPLNSKRSIPRKWVLFDESAGIFEDATNARVFVANYPIQSSSVSV